MKTTQIQPGLTSLFHAFEAAHAEAGIARPMKPLARRQWVNADERDGLFWQHTAFGSVKAIVRKFSVRDAGSEADASWARIVHEGMPREISVDFRIELEKGVTLFQCRFDGNGTSIVNKVADLSKIMLLNTPIDWVDFQSGSPSTDPRRAVPSTRKKGRDDKAFILIDSTGQFVQIEVSIRTIKGALWVAVQEIYTGQVVTTTYQKAEEISLTHHKDRGRAAFVAPLLPEGAYPGVDYLKSFGLDVVKAALEIGAFCKFSEASVAKWEDSASGVPVPGWEAPVSKVLEDLEKKGYVEATVLFFNISWNGGSGFVLLKDGRSCFVHAGQIMTETGQTVMSQGGFPFLHGREVVAVKFREEGGRLKATAIRKV